MGMPANQMKHSFIAIIPARFASTRFPGKPLVKIGGITMIERVYRQVEQTNLFKKIVVATDNEEIFTHVNAFGGEAVMTSEAHPSGTDRCYEAAQLIEHQLQLSDRDVVINIQGDEPFIHPEQILQLAGCFSDEGVGIATQAKEISDISMVFNPNTVKLIFDKNHKALYFSRAPIPFVRGHEQEDWLNQAIFYKHVGIYAYRLGVLRQLVQLPASRLEKLESLEQLRWLESGFSIHVALTQYESPSVDTPEDLNKLPGYANNK